MLPHGKRLVVLACFENENVEPKVPVVHEIKSVTVDDSYLVDQTPAKPDEASATPVTLPGKNSAKSLNLPAKNLTRSINLPHRNSATPVNSPDKTLATAIHLPDETLVTPRGDGKLRNLPEENSVRSLNLPDGNPARSFDLPDKNSATLFKLPDKTAGPFTLEQCDDSSDESSSSSLSSSSSSSSASSNDDTVVDASQQTEITLKKRGKKRNRNPNSWKNFILKKLKNAIQEHNPLKTDKTVGAKKIRPSYSTKQIDFCDVCLKYKNAPKQEKLKLQASYKLHQEEKSLARIEKEKDLKECHEPESTNIVITYDLQAVWPCPAGNSSVFFGRSRLHCYNFVMSNAKDRETTCFFWQEGLGNRGANEIGSCVYVYLKELANKNPGCDVIFYSDSGCSQQKNKFVFAMYQYAVTMLNINSIQHNFLFRGHTQTEGDTACSVIEKAISIAKKSGSIYIPEQYITLMRGAKKTGKPFLVKEMNYNDFFDLEFLTDCLKFNVTENATGDAIKVSEIKFTVSVLSLQKNVLIINIERRTRLKIGTKLMLKKPLNLEA